jgi:hypothetical protein
VEGKKTFKEELTSECLAKIESSASDVPSKLQLMPRVTADETSEKSSKE